MKKSANNLAVEEICKKLNEGTMSVFETEKYKAYLKTVSTFPTYSANNQILINQQAADATLVAGYTDWQKRGRHVIRGGKGIKIIAPKKRAYWVEKKDANGNPVLGPDGKPVRKKEFEHIGYCVKTVFDVSQTAGDPIPSITSLYSGKVDGFKEVLQILQYISPAPVCIGENISAYTENQIVIESGMTQQQTIRHLLPAVASEFIRVQDPDSVLDRESLEAESVSFVIAAHYGIDADYDFDYISDFASGKSLEELTASLRTIHDASAAMIKGIETARKAIA